MDLRKTGWEGVDWTYLDQSRDQWWAVVTSFSRRTLPHGVGLLVG